jgi:N-acetylmuramoyl-L-alanine amidase
MLVVISAGHGGRDPGAVRGDIYESHINLDISFKLAEILAQAGVPYHMIRTDDTFISLDNRVETANRLDADLFFSIHCNSFHDSDFSGMMTLVHSGVVNYQNVNGRTAGEVLHKRMIEATGAPDRGVRFRDKIVVLRETDMPAVEIEAGFLTNETELVKLLDDSYQWKIAAGASKGIIDVLDLILK